MQLLASLIPILFVTPGVYGLGINCRGSALCDIGDVGGTLDGVIKIVQDIEDGKTFTPGEHIACQGHLCAFSQRYDKDVTKQLALEKLLDLQ
jgi:hypothetical protein